MILGLDMSLVGTGWCVLDDEGIVINSGVIKTKPDDWRGKRIERCTHICVQATRQASACRMVAIEGYAFSQNRGHDLGELGGILRYRLMDMGVPYIELPPTEWRKSLLGNGALHKDKLRLAIFKKFGVEFDDMNTVEAYGVAETARQILERISAEDTQA